MRTQSTLPDDVLHGVLRHALGDWLSTVLCRGGGMEEQGSKRRRTSCAAHMLRAGAQLPPPRLCRHRGKVGDGMRACVVVGL